MNSQAGLQGRCRQQQPCNRHAHPQAVETPPAFVRPYLCHPRLLVSFSVFAFSLMVLGQTAFQRRTKWQLTVLPYFGLVWSACPLSKCILSFSREDIKDGFHCFYAMATTWQCRPGSADLISQWTVLKATPSSASKCACLGVNSLMYEIQSENQIIISHRLILFSPSERPKQPSTYLCEELGFSRETQMLSGLHCYFWLSHEYSMNSEGGFLKSSILTHLCKQLSSLCHGGSSFPTIFNHSVGQNCESMRQSQAQQADSRF